MQNKTSEMKMHQLQLHITQHIKWINIYNIKPTFTSEVSLWLFLQDLATEEKVRSGWSNFASFALRKNVVKGSYDQTNEYTCNKNSAEWITQQFPN